MDYTKIKNWLKCNLSDEKYLHSLETADNARKIAEIVSYKDPNKAFLAGLLHDCAKCMPKNQVEYYLQNLDIITDEEKTMPKTLHAPIGVAVAQKEFDIQDDEILSAIRYHTVAHKDMTTLEMIVFLADKIRDEFGDKYFGSDAFEYIEQKGLEVAMIKALQNGFDFLKTKNAFPCSLSTEAMEYFKSFQEGCL